MQTRGAPLIGAVAAYGLALAVREDASDENIQKVVEMLAETRPTAINLNGRCGGCAARCSISRATSVPRWPGKKPP